MVEILVVKSADVDHSGTTGGGVTVMEIGKHVRDGVLRVKGEDMDFRQSWVLPTDCSRGCGCKGHTQNGSVHTGTQQQ
jgi:hypothetical protein